MSVDENKKLALRPHREVFNHGNLAAADEIFAPDFVWHSPGIPPDLPKGPEGVKRFAAGLRTAFPDYQLTAEDTVAEGDRVVNRWVMRGTHRGEFMGVPATGKQLTVSGIDIFRIAGGKIVENRQELDVLGLLQQLGVIPRPEAAGAQR